MLFTTARLITVGLLIASAAAFVTGTTIERHTASGESPAAHQDRRLHAETGRPGGGSAGEGAASGESPAAHQDQGLQAETGRPGGDSPGEGAASGESPAAHQDQGLQAETGRPGGGSAGAEAASGESSATHAAEHSSETLLGVNPEATGLVIIAVAVSLVLALLILTVPSPLLAAGVALVMLAFIALDIREVTHQLNESHSGLAALAATVALLHLLAGAAALLTARGSRRHPRASTA